MILAILAAILWLERAAVLAMLPQMALSAAVFLGLALVLGTAVGRVSYSSSSDRFARHLPVGRLRRHRDVSSQHRMVGGQSLRGSIAFSGLS